MKNLIGILAILLLFSCSDSDSGSSKKYLPVSVDFVEDQGGILIGYDDQKRVKSLEEIGSSKYIFSYEADNVSMILKVGGQRPGYYNINYEGDKITSYTFEGDAYPVIYNEPQNILSSGVNLYPNGEIKNCISQQNEIVTLNYDTSKKGAMYHANRIILPMLLIDRESDFFVFHLSKHQLTGYSLGNASYSVEHDLDEHGFPQQSYFDFVGGIFSTLYQYESF